MYSEKFQNDAKSLEEHYDSIFKFHGGNQKKFNFASQKNFSNNITNTLEKNVSSYSINNFTKEKLKLVQKNSKPGIAKIRALNNSIVLNLNNDINYNSNTNQFSALSQFKFFSKSIKSKKNQESFDKNIPNIDTNHKGFTFLPNQSKNYENQNKNLNDDKIYLTKTLRNNKSLSQNLSKLSEIFKNESTIPKLINPNNKLNFPLKKSSQDLNIELKPLCSKKTLTQTFSNFTRNISEKSLKESHTSFTKIVPRFMDQIAINDYLIRNFNVGSQSIKQINSKQRIKQITNFYKTQKEKKLKSSNLIERKSLSNSSQDSITISEKESNNEDDLIKMRMRQFALQTPQKNINIPKEDVISPKENNKGDIYRDNFLFLRSKNKDPKESAAQYKISPKNTFRMRASHILTLNNDLMNHDQLSSLNYLKVPNVKNKKLKDFLYKIKKTPTEANPVLNNLTETNFLENFKKYKTDLDNQIIDTILAQKKMPAQSYLKMKFKKSTLEKFKQFELKLDPTIIN